MNNCGHLRIYHAKGLPEGEFVEREGACLICERNKLAEALRKYGNHTIECVMSGALREGRGHKDFVCQCGYADVLTVCGFRT